MTPALRLGLFGLVLTVVFFGALGIGALVGPFDSAPADHGSDHVSRDGSR